ncbi:DUF1206 domain-containing protein [Pontibacillus salicampi]|uniref:DUF1206 domain-containing protein n=1 Tax=Pontibacillus salicampi TaxID=1449801 RepID=A0ABV6LR23_9BACI
MDSVVSTKQRAKRSGKQASQDVKPWIRASARFGYAAKGSVYMLLGILSFMAAIGVGGKTTGTKGAFAALAQKPFGNILIWIAGIGLVGYVLWRVIQIIKNPEHKGVMPRIGFFISGILYSSLAIKAFSIVLGSGSGNSSSDGSKQTLTAKVLSQPFGKWVIASIGIGVIIYGMSELYRGITEKYKKQFKYGEMNSSEKSAVNKTGKIGLTARGIVFGIIGYFFIQIAITSSSNKSQQIGIDGALSKLAEQPFGQWLLGIVSVGLVLFGIFQILKAKNRHVKVS